MSSVSMDHGSPDNSEFHIYDIQAELISEICSYLQVHDQVSMKRVCKWWRINQSATFLSRLVDIDNLRMAKQSEEFLEHTLNMHVQKNTKVLVVRHTVKIKGSKEFAIIAKVIKQKHADLIQLTLKDCEKLVLDSYTIRDALCCTLNSFDAEMPCHISFEDRHKFFKDPPQIVIDRVVFDSTQPFQQHYHSFIVALNSNSPEVSPEIRDQVMQLYNSWSRCDADVTQWTSLRNLIQCLNEGLPVGYEDLSVNMSTLRQLDPLTFNKLTVQALHRLYF